MSHYTVLVIGDNIEEQLAPYDENLEVDPRPDGEGDPSQEAFAWLMSPERLEREAEHGAAFESSVAPKLVEKHQGRTFESLTIEERLEILETRRARLLRLRDEGAYSSQSLDQALRVLDAEQIGVEMRGGSSG